MHCYYSISKRSLSLKERLNLDIMKFVAQILNFLAKQTLHY